jgi:hypothetical protein
MGSYTIHVAKSSYKETIKYTINGFHRHLRTEVMIRSCMNCAETTP